MIWVISLLLIVSIYVNINLFRKTEKLEEANDELSDWLDNYSESLKNILTEIRELDSKNLFESDDEVGSMFDAIKNTIKSLEELEK
tara:strand:- start:734 stop:991 length:258 start_codon:yes stop_codon:yes gene_type:complete